MTIQFDTKFGQALCDLLATELGLVCSFMGEQGRIVASSERNRIGSSHAIAAQIMCGEIDEYAVSRQEAAQCETMREGLNMGIDFEGARLISFAIAGPLEVVRPVARLVRFSVMSLLRVRQQELAVNVVPCSDLTGASATSVHDAWALPGANLAALLSQASQRQVVWDLQNQYEQKMLESRTQALQSAHDELEARVAERTAALLQQLHFMQQLIEAIPGPVYYKDTESRYLGCNRAYETFMGKSASDIIGKTPRDIAPAELVQKYLAADRELFGQPGTQIYESEVRNAQGELRNVMFHKATFTRPDGAVGGLVGVMLDITERKRMEENLRQAATVFDSSAQGLTIAAADGAIMAVNRAFTEITGYEEHEVVGNNPRMLQSGRHDKAFYRAMWDCIAKHGRWQGEVWNRRKNGDVFPEWISITAVYDQQDRVSNYVATFSDITQQKQTEEKIQLLAFTDPLTSLPNRRLLLDRLQHALVTSLRSQRHGALFFIDLDDFKALNDTRGHHVGDLLLKQVAQRLTDCVREGDTVARLGGDEFVVMLEDLDSNLAQAISQAESVGAKILAALNHPYQLAAGHYRNTPSIGVTLFGDQKSSLEELLKQADLSMYRAKASGRNALRFFDPEMQSVVAARVDLEEDLRQGLLCQQFVLYYQPQVDHASRVTGVEALVRWQHPARGLVPPAEFIPLAEETKLILPLGLWVLQTACAQLGVWAGQPETAHLSMAVNISACQFHQGDFVEQVLAALDSYAFDASRLKLELTESLLLDDVQDVIAKMSALKGRGVSFSLDDFGTGYSSLAYLKRLPLDQLKIDQSFVRDVMLDANDAVIARTIVTLARSLGLGVIAEGVETEEQLLFLVSNNCHAFQGYLFSRPLPLADLEQYLSSAPRCSGDAGTLPPPGPRAESARLPL
ncbi:MAG: EAL domain-containing protein [Gammaproteobacteria bacterium]|uniref:EAL domain-containing protein n=1 Tax=Rhodoferax sp. TaxID=50421 RepID=UPI0017B43D52|nr:EAL domain-containing protein [Rhodoferax sp.]MBU3897442.1 EAL domain-containing protein [Gammaproteobacteria bacterium]MBA3056936.1 EAL domain-containing protein [Rhodoferax sp.]MBU3998489.1 EAL domain-containing protein [Gammaproteobacteria bacterium]MBU4018788.1 EAL domain-containing protein [Gammaproteobacteria bacterium]MBU4079743.1 EAL domain-containing protein [Gammaproteobacteria bacterium]